MTIGIVLVVCLGCANRRQNTFRNKHVDLELHSSATRLGAGSVFSVKVAILNQDVFSFNMTELTQPLPKCFDPTPGSFGIA